MSLLLPWQKASGGTLYERTVADSLSSISESSARSLTGARTLADSISSLTESISRVLTFIRSLADTLAGGGDGAFQSDAFQNDAFQMGDGTGITESVARTLTYNRSGSDSVSTLTEAVTRVGTFIRTAAETVGSLTEAAVRVLTSSRTVADSLSSLTETVSRILTFTRTAADAISTLTETVSRVATYVRSVVDSLSSITESVAGVVGNIVRTVSDSLASITEDVTRTATVSRVIADSLATLTEAVTRTATIVRSVADSIATLTEAVERVLSFVRSVEDSLATLTEAVTRVGTFARTVADSISSITEAVVAEVTSGTIVRTVADSISSISEAATRVITWNRTVADSLSSISEAATRVIARNRTVADSISSISEAVTKLGAFLRAVAELVPIVRERVAVIAPYVPDLPTTVELTIGATAVWAKTLYTSAHFETQVNGVPGQCRFRLRDDDRTMSFETGEPILLTINGQNVWRGFVTMVNRAYVFDALNVTQFGLDRFLDIEGTDINILLTKRIVFDQSDGAHVEAPLLSAHTADVTAIDLLLADWLDLTGDGLDTTTYVENVGDTTWTQEGQAWEGSDTWAQAMQSIASIPAAIFYIDPDKNFVYTDVDTPNAPFTLSDTPDGVTSFGYREMEVMMDGTALANDVMCWGMGYGSAVPVFVRDTDATSQAAHGLWQFAQQTFGVYKQSTIDRIAASIIDGSPENKRGAKDDRPNVSCVTYQHGLRVAQKVDFTSNVFGYNDVLPIRKMEVDFPSPETPKYSLNLSHEIDAPFSFFDPFLWGFKLPKIEIDSCPVGYIMGPQGRCIPIPLPQRCSPLACGITDSFDRTESLTSHTTSGSTTGQYAGIADCLLPWDVTLFESSSIELDGVALLASTFPTGGVASGTVRLILPVLAQLNASDKSFFFSFDALPPGSSDPTRSNLLQVDFAVSIAETFARVSIDGPASPDDDRSYISLVGTSSSTPIPRTFWVAGTTYTYTLTQGAVTLATISGGPGGPFVVQDATDPITIIDRPTLIFRRLHDSPIVGDPAITVRADALTIAEVTRCTAVQFDDFGRTVVSGWGASTPSGYTWTTDGTTSVSPWAGVLTDSAEAYVLGGVEWQGSSFSCLMHFTTGTVPTSGYIDLAFDIDQSSSTGLFVEAIFRIGNSGIGSTGGMITDGSLNGVDTSFTVLDDTGYYLRWSYDYPAGRSQMRAWLDTEAEPISWNLDAVVETIQPDADPIRFRVSTFKTSAAAYDQVIHSIDFDYAGKPCYPAEVTQGNSSSNSWTCESQISHGSDTIVTLSAYLPNSTQVWVNGILYAQASYIEDPATNSITLGFTPDSGDAIRVCYWAIA